MMSRYDFFYCLAFVWSNFFDRPVAPGDSPLNLLQAFHSDLEALGAITKTFFYKFLSRRMRAFFNRYFVAYRNKSPVFYSLIITLPRRVHFANGLDGTDAVWSGML
jgi:hypothetical protein